MFESPAILVFYSLPVKIAEITFFSQNISLLAGKTVKMSL